MCAALCPIEIGHARVYTEYIQNNLVRVYTLLHPITITITGESIKCRLKFVLAAWGMAESKLHCVVSDTASNMRKALEFWEWVACFLHVLNLIVKHSIFKQSGVVLLVKKIKTVIKKFRTPTGNS